MDKKAFLVAIYEDHFDRDNALEHLSELHELAATEGYEDIGRYALHVRTPSSANFISKGLLEKLEKDVLERQPDFIILDDEITPAQQRNLERRFGRSVIDRTELILRVFDKRAKSKEARLQVELASLTYHKSRLKRLWTHLSRQVASGKGSAYLKGEGEKQIEIDRRIVKRRIDELHHKLVAVERERSVQRESRLRSDLPLFALVGYTNVGKSTLLNALAESDAFVEDKLFATLDTMTRRCHLEEFGDILLIDTVGFIRKLPHLLIKAFKSTLEESLYADVLLHVVDISHPQFLEQSKASLAVLKELGAHEKPILHVLNKVDQLKDPSMIHGIRLHFHHSVVISAKEKSGLAALQSEMKRLLLSSMKRVRLFFPHANYGKALPLLNRSHILQSDFQEEGVLIEGALPPSLLGRKEIAPFLLEKENKEEPSFD